MPYVAGGIQGTKKYFVTMDDINNGYIPGRYANIVDDSSAAPSPSATSTTVQKGMFAKVTNVNYNANFRVKPSTASSIIGVIPKGTVLYLIDYSSGWYQVNYNGRVGWVSGTLLSSIPTGTYVAINNAYQLNIRSAASASSNIVGVLSANQYAQVLDYSADGKWMQIKVNGIQGYSSSQYLQYIY